MILVTCRQDFGAERRREREKKREDVGTEKKHILPELLGRYIVKLNITGPGCQYRMEQYHNGT